MKFSNYKYFFLSFVLLQICTFQICYGFDDYGTSGYGCNLGNNIYIQKLGSTSFYGTNYDVYNSNGTNYAIDLNNSSQPNKINSDDIKDLGEDCWVNSYVNKKNNNKGVRYGSLVYYTKNNSQQVPLDDYIGFFVVIIGGLGANTLYKRGLISTPQSYK